MISTRQLATFFIKFCFLTLCASLVITLPGTRPALAQAVGNVTLSAKIGYDGFCVQGTWLPIHVEVQNSGQGFSGVIEASYEKGSGGESITRMELELPANSRKEVFLYMHYSEGYSPKLTVNLFDGKKLVKQVSYRMNCLGGDSIIFGVLADNPSAYDVLNDVKPLRGTVRVAQLSISDLPNHTQAWDTLHALVISNVDTGLFTTDQRRALTSWVAAGGKLFIVGGLHWQAMAAGLQDLLPLDITSTHRSRCGRG